MSGNLTEEQLRRIEENKKKALARRAEKLGQTSLLKVNPVSDRPKIGVAIVSGPKYNVGSNVSNAVSVKPLNVSRTDQAAGTGATKSSTEYVGPGFKQSTSHGFGVKLRSETGQYNKRTSFPVNSSDQTNSTKVHVGIAPRTEFDNASSNSIRSQNGSSLPVTNPPLHSADVTEKKEMTVQERIEENRRRALEKLAEKKKSPAKGDPGAKLNPNSCAGFGSTSSIDSASKSGHSVTVGIQPFKSKSSTSFLNSFNKASADALNNRSSSTNQQPPSLSSDRTDNAIQSKSMFLNPPSTNQQQPSMSHNRTDSIVQSKNIFSSVGGKPVKGSCVLVSRERFEVNIGFSAPLVQLFKTMDTKLYGKL